MKIRICEYRGAGGTKRVCRHHAKVVVAQSVPFGYRLGPHGDEPVYRQELFFCCPYHGNTDPTSTVKWWFDGEHIGTLSIVEYEARLARAQEAYDEARATAGQRKEEEAQGR